MSKRIYVGNLPYAATSEELGASFSEYGQVVSARIAIDRDTGRSKGFAFIEMENDDEADKAIEALNGAEYLGRGIVVNEARPREERPGGFRRDQGGAPGAGDSRTRTYQRPGYGRR
jgi:cold-inducible RNA-binding protein